MITFRGDPVLPEHSLYGVDALLEQLYYIQDVIEKESKKGNDTEEEVQRVQKLIAEIHLVKEILEPRIKEYKSLDIDVLAKFIPEIAKQVDLDDYLEYIDYNPVIIDRPNSDSEDKLNERTEVFQSNFKMSWDKEFVDDLYQFLTDNEFISKKSRKDVLVRLFGLEAVPIKQRLIWIDSTLGKPNIKSLTTLFSYLITFRHRKKHGAETIGRLIREYFKKPSGELNQNSLNVNMAKMKRDDYVFNDSESKLDQFLLSKNRVYNRR